MKYNKLYIYIIILLLVLSCSNRTNDENTQEIYKIAHIIYDISIMNKDLAEADSLVKKYNDVVEKINNDTVKASSYYSAGLAYSHNGDFKNAFINIEKALNVTENDSIRNRVFIAKGEVFRELDLLDDALEIYNTIKNPNNRVGIIKNLDIALVNLDKATLDKTKYVLFLDTAKIHIDSAKDYFEKFTKENSVLSEDTARLEAFLNDIYGNYYIQKKEKFSALKSLHKAKSIRSSQADSLGRAESDQSFGEYYLKNCKNEIYESQYVDSAIFYLKKAHINLMGLAKEKITKQIYEAYNIKSKSNISNYKLLDSTKYYLKVYSSYLEDKTKNISEFLRIVKENEEKREKEIERRKYLIGYIIFLALVIIIIIVVFFLIKRSKHNKEINKQKDNIELCLNIGKDIVRNLDSGTILSNIINELKKIPSANVIALGEYKKETDILNFEKELTYYKNDVQYKPYKRSLTDKNQLAVYCFDNSEIIFSNNIKKEYTKWINKYQDGGRMLTGGSMSKPANSVIYVPIITKDKEEKIGIISIQSHSKNAFNESDIYLLENVAAYVAIALRNSKTVKKLKKKQKELNKTIAELTDTKDKLIKAEKKNKLIHSGILHEAKNLFPPIPYLLSKLNDESYKNKKNLIHDITEYSSIMSEYIEDLKTWLEIQKDGKIDFKVFEVNKNYINQITNTFKPICKEKEKDIITNISPCKIRSNKKGIEVILRNLIINGIIHGTDNTVYLDIVEKNEDVIFTVKNKADEGILNKIKEKLTGKIEKLEKKAGLGIYLCREYGDFLSAKWEFELDRGYIKISFLLNKGLV